MAFEFAIVQSQENSVSAADRIDAKEENRLRVRLRQGLVNKFKKLKSTTVIAATEDATKMDTAIVANIL